MISVPEMRRISMLTNYRDYVRPGKGRCDLSGILADPEAMTSLTEDMSAPFLEVAIDKVVALDAIGFVFGARIAQRLNTGLVLMRKPGKLSVETRSISFSDYTKTDKSFEIAADAIKPNESVLIVDDWSETGAQLKAAAALVESIGGKVVGLTCINIDSPVCKDEALSKYRMHSVIEY
ncbi:MAG: phosphoribosyltransferase family protein [FCB group bacterium]|jgi:adenine phosphoribosyltransferase|nr:phosphoribosyltransferase family protein [FCB group bacterium]